MIPGDISDVPTLACLNKPQKRALILRDQLRYLEPTHLDTFLDGVTADEPPTYRSVNGHVWPPLAQITIKEQAARFDLGNVQFPEEGGKTYRACLTVEEERFEMRTEDPLPRDDAELASVAIHRFVAENMFPLFKTKYKAIHARMEKINEARRVAYNMLHHPPAKFEEGETMARLHSTKKANGDASREGSSRKRKEVAKHVSNKRQRIGLETIPDNVKSETFNTIPAQIKVDLFNNIIKTAFPNLDNLIIASWNVVSVYANVGSDFPELHRAVVELKGVLEELESAYAPRSKHTKGRKDAPPSQQSSTNGSRPATPTPIPIPIPMPTASRESRSPPPSATKPPPDNNSKTASPPPLPLAQHAPPHLLRTTHHLALQERRPAQQTRAASDRTPEPSRPPRTRSRSAEEPSTPGSELLRKRQAYAKAVAVGGSSVLEARSSGHAVCSHGNGHALDHDPDCPFPAATCAAATTGTDTSRTNPNVDAAHDHPTPTRAAQLAALTPPGYTPRPVATANTSSAVPVAEMLAGKRRR